ncbi:MAG: tetratricopeptide repeat protein [Fibrella sp.]|nr:tetratricopeptide repeat protein [Armatimonadota bacterium]
MKDRIAMDAALPCCIYLLGGLRIEVGNEVVTRFRTQKTGALLAYLALHIQRAHSREELADLFWPDIDPEAARANLRSALSSLRRQIEPPASVEAGSVLVTRGHFEVYLNAASVGVDAIRFDRAIVAANRAATTPDKIRLRAEAVALYRGPLLPGFYEPWALQERNRLGETLSRTLIELAAQYAGIGSWNEALAHARRAVGEDPLAEDAHAYVIRALMASGQTSAAHRQFEELTAVLEEQLGAKPSPALQALLQPVERPVMTASEVAPLLPPAVVENPLLSELPIARRSLPLPLSGFFGREDELIALGRLLCESETRLVTLTGFGGSGKTRLAIEVVRQVADRFAGGVWFVPLADLRDAEHIADAVADTLSLPPATKSSPFDRTVGTLNAGGNPVLLVLDNLEQLMETQSGVAEEYVHRLLERVPRLTCLTTSRRRLMLDGEREFAVVPLPTPLHPGTPERLLEFASVQLFVQRAQTARPDFQITPRNADAIAMLCTRLEGVPLALELAAGWSQTLTPTQVMAKLENRFDLLIGRRRGAPGRHATLRAAVEWSWELLAASLQAFWARLSVFRGGWDMEAAESVTQTPDAMTLLAELRERSVIVSEESGGDGMRFRMLETLREFAEEQLPPAERERFALCHAAYYLHLAETAQWDGNEQQHWLTRMDAEQGNIRVAFETFARANDVEGSLRLAIALFKFWLVRGHLAEGRQRLDAALGGGENAPDLLRARALLAAGGLAGQQGDLVSAQSYFEKCMPIFEREGDRSHVASAMGRLAIIHKHRGEYDHAEALLNNARAIYGETDNKRGLTRVLAGLGALCEERTDLDRSRDFYEECLALTEQINDTLFAATTLHNIGVVAARQNDVLRACAFLERSLAIRRELNDRAGLAATLEALGVITAESGDWNATEAYYGESYAIHQQMQNRNGAMRVRLNQAKMMLRRGDTEAVATYLDEAVLLLGSDGNKRYTAYALEIGALLAARGHREREAAQLFGASEALRDSVGIPLTPQEEDEYTDVLQTLRVNLGATALSDARKEGRSRTWQELAALLRVLTPTKQVVLTAQ